MISTKFPRPLDVARVRQRLDQWRRTRAHPRSPIPKGLWASAVALARQQELYQTARALHLDYGGLKAHVETADARGGRRRRTPAFVEVSGIDADGSHSLGDRTDGTRRHRASAGARPRLG
jgi:hypothetical protein